MSEYVRVIEEEDEGIGTMKALAILSANEHRSTTHWRLIEEQHFKNGRLDETHIFVKSSYDKPDEHFEESKFLSRKIVGRYSTRTLPASIRPWIAEPDASSKLPQAGH